MESYPAKRLYFDIETTGLSPETSALTIIGCCDEQGTVVQWFNEDGRKQEEILSAFFAYCKTYDTLVSFNGKTFDFPFLQEKSRAYHLDSPIASMRHLDIYQALRPYQRLFGLSSMGQKHLESYIGLKRKDTLSGKKMVSTYQDFLDDHDSSKKERLLLHNKEDVLGLQKISDLLTLISLQEGEFHIEKTNLTDDMLTIVFSFPGHIPCSLKVNKEHLDLELDEHNGILTYPLTDGHTYHYYPNPKDYDYLPAEDTIIPRTMASFVDATHRQRASKETCYQRFIPNAAFFSQDEEVHLFVKDSLIYLLSKD